MFPFRKSRPARRSQPRAGVRLELETLEDRRLMATIATAGVSDVFVIRPDKSVWENIGAGWVPLTSSGFASSISAVTEPAVGDFVLFALTTGGSVFQYRTTLGWSLVGSTFTAISAGTDANGFADVFALTSTGGALYEFNNSGVFELGTFINSVAASNNGIVYATLTNNAVWAFDPVFGWFALTSAGFSNQVSAQMNASTGDQVVFAVNLSGSVFQWTLNGGWSLLGSTFKTISAGQDTGGNADVYALTANNALFEFLQSPTRAVMVGNFVSDAAATTNNRVFVILTNGAVWGFDTTFGWFDLTSPGFAQP